MASPNGHFWIGLRKHCSECAFEWDDWYPMNYNKWGKGEPNNDAIGEGKYKFLRKQNMSVAIFQFLLLKVALFVDCVEQYCKEDKEIPENDGWNDENCNVECNFVCEVYPEGGFSINDQHNYPMTGPIKKIFVLIFFILEILDPEFKVDAKTVGYHMLDFVIILRHKMKVKDQEKIKMR